MDHNPFDILLSNNVPHILENIFFSLDYKSFNICLEVSQKWHTLLNSEVFRRKARALYQIEILGDESELHEASVDGNMDMVKKLTSCVLVNLNRTLEICPITGQLNSTPLSVAAYRGHLNVEKLLLERGAIPDNTYKMVKNERKLWHAAQEGNVEEVTRLISVDGVDKDCSVGKNRSTPLRVASENGHKHVVQFLLQEGADLGKFCRKGLTALVMASLNGHKGVVQLLLRHWSHYGVKSINFTP